jgi:hypothetical protein
VQQTLLSTSEANLKKKQEKAQTLEEKIKKIDEYLKIVQKAIRELQ